MRYNTHIIRPNNIKQLYQEMERIGADPVGIKIMVPKGVFKVIKVQNLSLKAVHILKQEMLSRGAEMVVHKEVSMLKKEVSDVLLLGTIRQLRDVIRKLKVQPFGLKSLAQELQEALKNEKEKEHYFNVRDKQVDLREHTLVMGILNVTPDSFSDGGKFNRIEEAINHAKEMVKNGADLIDVGGESTRPGHAPVSLSEELERVIPIIEALRKEINVPISIDTYKGEVAARALNAGADIINDVWGFKKDPTIAKVAADYNVPVILMHNRDKANYNSLIADMISDLRESIDIAIQAGVEQKNIILDPGIGFGKTYEDNLQVMNHLDDIVALGYPVLLGTSRKSMIGNALNLPVDERVEGTAATVALGIAKGCKIIRVHDVKEMKRVAKMMDAMLYLK